jgi:2,3-bisphosphoglycerate-independent phosphoglycerate mutase
MKYVVLVGDGMAGYPWGGFGGKTSLQAARTPNMDRMARCGELGLVKMVPEGFTPGSEIANLSILGYDPESCFTGRGPLEAASLGVSLADGDIAFRCNLVTLGTDGARVIMEDFSAGHITNDEARRIILDLDREIGTEEVKFYPGVSYRHLMVRRGGGKRFPGIERLTLTPPHDIIGKRIDAHLPGTANPGAVLDDGREELLALTEASRKVLESHPVNVDRRARGEAPANSIWLWGQGRAPQMKTLAERFGVEGAVISAVDLLKGIGRLAGLETVDVPGATGYLDTNYEGKARYALDALREKDFVFVHVEAPDEAGHMGDPGAKVKAIEAFDEKVVGTVLEGMKTFDAWRVLVLPDHPTPLSLRTHTSDPVPFALYAGGEGLCRDGQTGFDEASARETGLLIERGTDLIARLFDRGQSA